MFACPLFRKLSEPNENVKIKGADTDNVVLYQL